MLVPQGISLQHLGQTLLQEGDYDQAINFYEQAVETEPEITSHYWYLGLAYLLQQQEETAQATWALAISQGSAEEIEQWTEELSQILDLEARRQANLNNTQTAWLIRQYIREINPTQIDNLLHLILLSLTLDFTPELLQEWQVVELLEQSSLGEVNPELLLQVVIQLIEFPFKETVAFVAASLPHAHPPDLFVDHILTAAIKVAYQHQQQEFASKIAELCLDLIPNYPPVLQHLSGASHFCKNIKWQAYH